MADEEWPIYRAVVRSFGQERLPTYTLLRETFRATPAEAKALLGTTDIEIVRGPQLHKVEEVAARFRATGAVVEVELLGSPPRVSAQEALQMRRSWMNPKPLGVEGYLVVTGLFSYLAPEHSSESGIFVSGPELSDRMEEKVPILLGSSVRHAGRAIVEGFFSSWDLPMFPVALAPVVVTFFQEDPGDPEVTEPIRIEFF